MLSIQGAGFIVSLGKVVRKQVNVVVDSRDHVFEAIVEIWTVFGFLGRGRRCQFVGFLDVNRKV